MIEQLMYNYSPSRITAAGPITGVDVNREIGTTEPPADEVGRLKLKVSALELAVEALVKIAVDSGKIDERGFLELCTAIDAEDGVIDGQRDLHVMRKNCPMCGRTNVGDRNKCIWCGADTTAAVPDARPQLAG